MRLSQTAPPTLAVLVPLVQILTVQVTCVFCSFYFMLCSSLCFVELFNFMQHPARKFFWVGCTSSKFGTMMNIDYLFFPLSHSHPLRSLSYGWYYFGSVCCECWSILVIVNSSFGAVGYEKFIKIGFICHTGNLIWFAEAFPLLISDYSFAREIIAQGYRWRSGWGSCRWHD